MIGAESPQLGVTTYQALRQAPGRPRSRVCSWQVSYIEWNLSNAALRINVLLFTKRIHIIIHHTRQNLKVGAKVIAQW